MSGVIDALRYDVVEVGPLAEGWRYQRGTPAYVVRLNGDELRRVAGEAQRYAEMGNSVSALTARTTCNNQCRLHHGDGVIKVRLARIISRRLRGRLDTDPDRVLTIHRRTDLNLRRMAS